VNGQIVAAELFAANPGPAAHLALVGIVAAAALVVFGSVRRRNKREAAEAEMHSQLTVQPVRPSQEPQGGHMNYALLVYITPELWERLSPEETRRLHGGYQAAVSTSAEVIAHYRFRPPKLTTTVRLATDQIVRTEGPASHGGEGLRALYLLESDEPDAVLDFASQHPAVRVGGSAEVWPLIAPGGHDGERQDHGRWKGRH
jgi:hypothetical protein